jgi:capsid protein
LTKTEKTMHTNGNTGQPASPQAASSQSSSERAAATAAADPAGARIERKLLEAYYDLWDSFVDPREAFWDDAGGWLPLGVAGGVGPGVRPAIVNEQQLCELRAECRQLAASNEFAINGHENRISYLVGSGHTYRATIRKGRAANARLAAQVQEVLDEFLRANKWQRRQQEIVRRLDRDGEAFLRFFVDAQGATQVRFVEPDQVVTPSDQAADPAASFGVLTDAADVESVLAYYVDAAPIDAAQIQHRKANVDGNVKRGLPLFFPVRKNLRRADKLLRNMSVVAEIQSAIALIRKHQGGIRSGVQQFAAAQTDVTLTQASGRTTSFRRFGPGTILDAPGGIEYDFPAAGLDAGNFVAVLQAELRAIASRLVMPEFMLTSDASNANYSSTMVAEGPAMRMFARLQADLVNDDLEVMWRVVKNAVRADCLPADALSQIEIQVSPPSLATRDQKQEAEVSQIEYQNGILSPQTWCRRRGLDYDQEQANLVQHAARPTEVQGTVLVDPIVGSPLIG